MTDGSTPSFSFPNSSDLLLAKMFGAFTFAAGFIALLGTFSSSGSNGVGFVTGSRGWARSEPSLPRTVVYHHEQTFAVLTILDDGTLLNCSLIETIEEDEIATALSRLQRTYPVSPVSFKTILDVASACRNLTFENERPRRNSAQLTAAKPDTTTKRPSIRDSIFKGPLSLLRGIVPGTKWCGSGDIATGYQDLGNDWEIDACCREHDHCPVKVKAFRTRYGFFNTAVYTKSHCDCDGRFMECLKGVNSSISNILGQAYFDLLHVQCLVSSRHVENGTVVVKEVECPFNFYVSEKVNL